MSVYLPVCKFVCLTFWMSVCLYICLYVFLSVSLSAYLGKLAGESECMIFCWWGHIMFVDCGKTMCGSTNKWYVLNIIRKNSQPKKMIFTMPLGRFSYLTFDPKIWKTTFGHSKNHFFRLRVFSYNLENIPLRLKPVLSRSDQTGSSSFYRGKEGSALHNWPKPLKLKCQLRLF